MKTLHLSESETKKAAEILKNGGIVAIPTETVYGLASNTFNVNAIKKIFEAKGRPADNPLIVHIANLNDIHKVASEFNEKAQKLANKFWPGPLTMILPKNKDVPSIVTAGMNSVAVRFPSNEVAREIINLSGDPLVAPSANISGSPSPTKFKHVVDDLENKVDALVDGGECKYGLESTVISLLGTVPKLLRPGAITPEEIEKVIGKIEIDNSVYSKIKEGQKALCPGMKYKHYSPKANVILLEGSTEKYTEFIKNNSKENLVALCFDEDIPKLLCRYIPYGSQNDFKSQAKKLFSSLREADKLNPSIIYAHCPHAEGIGIAVYNRLIRSAGFDIIKL